MKLYISGPMRGIPQFNFPAFDIARDYLVSRGHTVISPADHDREVEPTVEQTDAYRTGIGSRNDDPAFQALIGWDLRVCADPSLDGIVFLPGWERSTGAKHERYVAEVCGKRFFYLRTEHQVDEQWLDGDLFVLAEELPAVVIGLMGYAQSGKDTVAGLLHSWRGFERVAFADPLRSMLYALNPVVRHDRTVTRLADLVDTLGWEGAKRKPEVRKLMQRLGTEAGRNVLGASVWVDTAMRKVRPGGRYVFADVRFPNEAVAIKDAGGQLWRVVRRGFGPVNDHPSETALDDTEPDVIVRNNGTIADLQHHVSGLLDAVFGG